jgi:hypothetical protein
MMTTKFAVNDVCCVTLELSKTTWVCAFAPPESGRASSLSAQQQTFAVVARAVRRDGDARAEGWHRCPCSQIGHRSVALCRARRCTGRRNTQSLKPSLRYYESLPPKRQGGLATGKIDGFLEPRSSLVAARAFQAPAYVNTDCGAKCAGLGPDTS